MKTLVVYDSVYGNTETVARTIGEAILGEVRVLRVRQVKADDWQAADLFILGSPTHGALPTEAVQGSLERIGPPTRKGARAATLDALDVVLP
jgi:flavodoxin